MTKQRREGETNSPRGQRPARASRTGSSWAEFVRLAHQAVVAFAGAGTTNRAEPRACGHSRDPRCLDSEPGSERIARAESNGAGSGFGRAPHQLAGASNRIGNVAKEKMWRRGPGRPVLLGFQDFLRHILFGSYKVLRKPIKPLRREGLLLSLRSGASQRAKASAFIFRSLSA
jgi:hypothetical protein